MEELRRNAGCVCISETIFDGQAEQGVELDHVLPDYYPEIFRILSCRLDPHIMSYSLLNDSKLMIDGNVDIKVLYLAEGSNAVHCIGQKYTYSKTIDIGKGAVTGDGDICVKLSSRSDYCNCRAVSGRRIDVRGAVSTKVHITSDRAVSLPVIPRELQIREQESVCCSNIVAAEKQFTVREEIETGAAGIGCILRTTALPKISDVRIIADKAVIKGQVTVNAAYGIYKEGEQGCTEIERMTADIPVSQIVEVEGIDDEHSCTAEIDVLSCELNCSSDNGIVSCNMLAVCRLRCCKESSVSIPVDVFSTEYETEHSMKTLKAARCSSRINRPFTLRSVLSCEGSEIEAVWDCSAEAYNVSSTVTDNGDIKLTGLICCQALCRNTDGVPCHLERQESFEQIIAADGADAKDQIDINVICLDTDHSIKTDGTLEVIVSAEAAGRITSAESIAVADNVTVHEDRAIKRDNCYALRICYADGKESSWDIAKRYRTSVASVLNENDITDSDELLSGMILIPTI